MRQWNRVLTLVLLMVCVACSNGGTSPALPSGPVSDSNPGKDKSEDSALRQIAVVPATPLDCPSGGSLILTFIDSNLDGVVSSNESVLSTNKICNGVNGSNGSDGVGTGIEIEVADAASCPAGGSRFKTFGDTNNNGVLDLGESLRSLTTLCNGISGTNGESAHLSVAPASLNECPAGGFVYSSSVGSQNPSLTTVCHGSAGQNANFTMGAVGEAVANKNYSACHHDYLYIPNAHEASRGWLTFRHQGNGAYDQGIGSTGFQVWNVDIVNFVLASEVNNVSYCALHWDPILRRLSYTVLDNTDGLAGTQGLIQL